MPATAQQNTIVSSASSGSEPSAMPWSSEPNTDLDHVDEPEHDDNGERDAQEPKQGRPGFTPPTDLRNHLRGAKQAVQSICSGAVHVRPMRQAGCGQREAPPSPA